MSALDRLAACAGSWRGTNRLQDPMMQVEEESPSTATVTALLGGRFLRLDYTWAYQGKPQEGSLLIGYRSAPEMVTAHWIDTWHMGESVMACQGSAGADGSIVVRGTYAAPPGPDWGWRTELKPGSGGTLRMIMHNVHPDGTEELAVEADYVRSD